MTDDEKAADIKQPEPYQLNDLQAAMADFATAKFSGQFFGTDVYEKYFCNAWVRGAAYGRKAERERLEELMEAFLVDHCSECLTEENLQEFAVIFGSEKNE